VSVGAVVGFGDGGFVAAVGFVFGVSLGPAVGLVVGV
jgi:hypothetical protein